MSLYTRIATIAALLFVGAAVAGLAWWKPASERAFVARSDSLLRETESGFQDIARSLVDKVVAFSASAAQSATEDRARSIADLPLDLYMDGHGHLDKQRLKEDLRIAVTDAESGSAEKHAAVREEILARVQHDVQERSARLRKKQQQAAARLGGTVAWRSMAAWGGLLLILLAAGALLLDRAVVRPVRSVTGAVVRFGAGDRGVRAEVAGGAEVAALADAFNSTAEAVQRTEAENAELRAGLEEKVKERTAALVRAARASTAGTMAGGIAHEFNNLLGGILGCAEAALHDEPSAAVRESLEMVRKTARRGVGITRAILSATRAEPSRAPCDPAEVLEEALAEVRPPSGIEVVKSVDHASIDADPAMLRQVFANLVRNAVEAMEEEGRLELTGGASDGEYVVAVRDSGPGIDPAVRDILFEPFVTTRRGGREGAGLGLFLAERLVAAHGGRVEVESKAGDGSQFTIHLPALARDS